MLPEQPTSHKRHGLIQSDACKELSHFYSGADARRSARPVSRTRARGWLTGVPAVRGNRYDRETSGSEAAQTRNLDREAKPSPRDLISFRPQKPAPGENAPETPGAGCARCLHPAPPTGPDGQPSSPCVRKRNPPTGSDLVLAEQT